MDFCKLKHKSIKLGDFTALCAAFSIFQLVFGASCLLLHSVLVQEQFSPAAGSCFQRKALKFTLFTD